MGSRPSSRPATAGAATVESLLCCCNCSDRKPIELQAGQLNWFQRKKSTKHNQKRRGRNGSSHPQLTWWCCNRADWTEREWLPSLTYHIKRRPTTGLSERKELWLVCRYPDFGRAKGTRVSARMNVRRLNAPAPFLGSCRLTCVLRVCNKRATRYLPFLPVESK